MGFCKTDIIQLVNSTNRRWRLLDFQHPLKAPGEFDPVRWNICFPFTETFVPAFENIFHDVPHDEFRSKSGKMCFSFIPGSCPDQIIMKIRKWIRFIEPHVGLRDCLEISFALDFDRRGGNPNNQRTKIGELRKLAKPYDREPTKENLKYANVLIASCFDFLGNVQCYEPVSAVVGIPPSDPNRAFNLPAYLAEGISQKWGRENLTKFVKTTKTREGLKDVEISRKLEILEGTIEVNPKVFRGKKVLLVDDLYQSGVTINYVGMLLLQAGASRVFALACEKTCRNDDNTLRAE